MNNLELVVIGFLNILIPAIAGFITYIRQNNKNSVATASKAVNLIEPNLPLRSPTELGIYDDANLTSTKLPFIYNPSSAELMDRWAKGIEDENL